MKPFDLQKALAGEPVVTRTGEPVTELYHFNTCEGSQPVRAVISKKIYSFSKKGSWDTDGLGSPRDLFMAPVKKQEWRNIYKMKNSGKLIVSPARYASYEDAIAFEYEDMDQNHCDFVHPVKIHEWEE